MRINLRKKKKLTDEQLEIISTKDFFDRIVPGIIRFYTDHYICGNFYKSCWAVTEYPQTIVRKHSEKSQDYRSIYPTSRIFSEPTRTSPTLKLTP